MTQALWPVGGAGGGAALFALGVLWERHRRPPPPTVHEVFLHDDRDDREP